MNELPIPEGCNCNRGVCGEYEIGAVKKRMGIDKRTDPPTIFTTHELIRECDLFKARLKFYLNHFPKGERGGRE